MDPLSLSSPRVYESSHEEEGENVRAYDKTPNLWWRLKVKRSLSLSTKEKEGAKKACILSSSLVRRKTDRKKGGRGRKKEPSWKPSATAPTTDGGKGGGGETARLRQRRSRGGKKRRKEGEKEKQRRSPLRPDPGKAGQAGLTLKTQFSTVRRRFSPCVAPPQPPQPPGA